MRFHLLRARANRVFPVNPSEFTTAYGLRYVDIDLIKAVVGDRVKDGLVMCCDGMYFVAVNPKSTSGRNRFTAAHEAAHVALGHLPRFDPINLQDEPTKMAEWTLKVLDREADMWAAEVLMPAALVRRLDMTADEIARYFGVSKQASEHRLRDVWRYGAKHRLFLQQVNLCSLYSEFIAEVVRRRKRSSESPARRSTADHTDTY